MNVQRQITIARPPGQVLAYVADVRNDPTWHTDVLEVSSSTDEVAVGTVFNVRLKPSMGVSQGTMTVRRLEPGRLVQFEGHMGRNMVPTVTNSVEAEGSGTRLTRSIELDPPGAMRLMSPMIKRKIGSANEGFLENLKRRLENSAE